MATTIQTIEVEASQILILIQTVLPVIEQYVPAIAAMGGPIGLGVSAAAALLPLLSKIPTGLISDADQLALAARIEALQTTAFSGPEWQPRPDPVVVPPPLPPVPGPATK